MCTLYLSPSRCTPRRSRNRTGPQYAEGEKWGTTWAEVSGGPGGWGGRVSGSPKFSEFSEFSEFLEFFRIFRIFRIFAKFLKFQNFRKIQNFRSLYGIFLRIVKGGDSHIALYFPQIIYYSAFYFPKVIYYSLFPQVIYCLFTYLLVHLLTQRSAFPK